MMTDIKGIPREETDKWARPPSPGLPGPKGIADKGERIRGRDLKISEQDVFRSLPFFRRVSAFIFGGYFIIGDPVAPKRGMFVHVPSMLVRFYYKRLYKLFHKTVGSKPQ